jgi:hypothetical protein
MLGLKNKFMGVQKRRKENKNLRRDIVVRLEEYMRRKFGDDSQQRHDIRVIVLRIDDLMLRERATKFKEFLDVNNERATKAFCMLSKDGGGLCDDITQIRDESGNNSKGTNDRGAHIKGFYDNIYKKKG